MFEQIEREEIEQIKQEDLDAQHKCMMRKWYMQLTMFGGTKPLKTNETEAEE